MVSHLTPVELISKEDEKSWLKSSCPHNLELRKPKCNFQMPKIEAM